MPPLYNKTSKRDFIIHYPLQEIKSLTDRWRMANRSFCIHKTLSLAQMQSNDIAGWWVPYYYFEVRLRWKMRIAFLGSRQNEF